MVGGYISFKNRAVIKPSKPIAPKLAQAHGLAECSGRITEQPYPVGGMKTAKRSVSQQRRMLRGWAAAHSVTALYPKLNRMKGIPAPAAVHTIPLGNVLKGSTAAQIQILFRNDMEETTNEH